MVFGSISALVSGALTCNMLRNLRQRTKLSDAPKGEQRSDAPRETFSEILLDLTLVIPARDEAKNLRELLPQIQTLSPRPAQVLVMDDGSRDDTAQLIDAAQLQSPWIQRCAVEPLPAHWRGKVWVLQQALARVQTTRVLFVDADVRLNHPQCVAQLRALFDARGAAFATVFPRPQVNWRAALLVDQIYTHLYYFLPFNADRLAQSSAVAGCGQIMMADVARLRENGGLQNVRGTTHDGLQLARSFKARGLKVLTVDGQEAFGCITYDGFRSAFRGFSRNSFEATQSVPATLVICGLLFWVFVLPFVLLPVLWLHPAWLAAFLFMLYGQYRVAREQGLRMSHVPLTPAKALASIGVHLWSATRAQLGLATQWRGRTVSNEK